MERNKEKEALDRISKEHSYVEGFNGRLAKYRAMKIFELSKPGGKLLELGCGEGLLLREFAKREYEMITGVEASESYLREAEQAVKGHAHAALSCSLLEEFETDSKYDTIIASGILEHVEEPVSILKRAANWLNGNGSIIIIVPNALAFHRRLGIKMGLIPNAYHLSGQDHKVGHRRYYDMGSLEKDVVSAGLRIVNKGGIFLKPFSNVQMESYPENVCDGLYLLGQDLPAWCAEIYVQADREKW